MSTARVIHFGGFVHAAGAGCRGGGVPGRPGRAVGGRAVGMPG